MTSASETRVIWLAITVIAAVIVALVAGGLSYIDNRRPVTAVMRGGVAFGATIGCLLGIYAYLT